MGNEVKLTEAQQIVARSRDDRAQTIMQSELLRKSIWVSKDEVEAINAVLRKNDLSTLPVAVVERGERLYPRDQLPALEQAVNRATEEVNARITSHTRDPREKGHASLVLLGPADFIELLSCFGTLARLAERLHVLRPDATTGIYRQSFISNMSFVDATVFDLARLALKVNFAELAPKLAKSKKIPLEDLSPHQTLGSLHDFIIEDILKPLYLKGLIIAFRNQGGVPTAEFDEYAKAQGGFLRLIEYVNRRNAHLHSRGYVDQKYLEPNKQTRKVEYNLDNLKLGDYAEISELYFNQSMALFSRYIEEFAAWIDAGAKPNPAN